MLAIIRLLIALVLLASLTPAAEAASVRLLRDVTVEDTLIRLGDIAEIEAADEKLKFALSEIELQPAPVPGQVARITYQDIISRLRAHQVDLSQVEVRGRSTITVKRVTDRLSTATPRIIATSFNQPVSETKATPRTLEDHPEFKLSTAQLRHAENRVLQAIRDHLAEHAPDWGTPKLFVQLPPRKALLVLDAAADGLTLIASKEIRDDRYELTFEVQNEEHATESLTVLANITRRPRVWSAKYPIAAGQQIGVSDLQLKEVDDIANGVTEQERLIGKEARRAMRPGDILKEDQLQEPALIKRGDVVSVVSESNGCRAVMNYRAKTDGKLGQMIAVETGDRRQTLMVRVTGSRTASTDEAPQSDSAGGIRVDVSPEIRNTQTPNVVSKSTSDIRSATAEQRKLSPASSTSKLSPIALRKK